MAAKVHQPSARGVSRARLLGRSRARLDAPAAVTASPALRASGARTATAREEQVCAASGCLQPARFQPQFVVGYPGRRLLVRDLLLRVCGEHRRALHALFQRASALELLRSRLAERRSDPPGSVRVLFELIG
jgi:hypothetical protein